MNCPRAVDAGACSQNGSPNLLLPGVMTVGAAQILLKTADIVPEGRAVLAGQGPLLYLTALQLARAGAPPLLVLETTPATNYHAATARYVGELWRGRRELGKGLGSVDFRDSHRDRNVIQGFPLEGGDLERDGPAGVER